MNDRTIVRIILFFAAIAVVLVAVAVFAVRNINRSLETSDWVNHTHAVILESHDLLAALRVGDAALQLYLMSGDARDQSASRDAFAAVAEHREILAALTRGDPAGRTQIAGLLPLVSARLEVAAKFNAARPDRAAGAAALREIDAAGSSLGEIERRLNKFKEEQMALLARQDTASYLQAQATRWTVWIGLGLNVLLLGGAVWLIRDDLNARRLATTALQTANEQLEARVRERTAELVSANEQLTVESLERQWANQALEHQLRYDRLIVDSVNDLVLVLTRAMNISRLNPAVSAVTGFEASALINRPLSDLVRLTEQGTSQIGRMADPVAHALNTGHELRNQPALLKDKLGGETSVRLTLCPLRDGNKIVGGIIILRVSDAA